MEHIYYCEEFNQFKVFDQELHDMIVFCGGADKIFEETVVYVGTL